MRATHWAIHYSEACDKGGNGQCEGDIDVPRNPNSVGTGVAHTCTCPCHDADDLPPTVEGVRAWHDDFHGVEA